MDSLVFKELWASGVLFASRCMFVAKTVYTCPTVKISSSLKMHVYTYAHTHTPTKYVSLHTGTQAEEAGLPWVCSDGWGSGGLVHFQGSVLVSD